VEIRGLHLTRAHNKKTTAGHISSSIRSMAKSKLEFMRTEGLPECHYMSGEFNFLGAQLSQNLDNPKDVCTTRLAFAEHIHLNFVIYPFRYVILHWYPDHTNQCCGSVTLINGSGCGSGRAKNIRILRIRNSGTFKSFFKNKKS
jgi:hypothetical protein